MSVDRMVFTLAGIFILISVALTQYHDPNWMWFTVFVGANLMQAGITRWCPLAKILKRLGTRPGTAFE